MSASARAASVLWTEYSAWSMTSSVLRRGSDCGSAARLRESRNAMIGLSRVRHVVRIQPRHVAVSARVVDPWLLSNRERFPAVRFRMTGQAA